VDQHWSWWTRRERLVCGISIKMAASDTKVHEISENLQIMWFTFHFIHWRTLIGTFAFSVGDLTFNMLLCKSRILICGFCSTVLQKNLALELRALKEIRSNMSYCLELMQFVRKDLETMAENMELLEGIYYWQASTVCCTLWH